MNAVAVPPEPAQTKPSTAHRGAHGDRKALVDLQRTMHKLAQDDNVQPHIRAQCARAWSDLQERKRIMDGKPLPGQLRPDLQQVKQHKRKGPSLLPLPEVPAVAPENKVSQESP
jgi:hypothetical protein